MSKYMVRRSIYRRADGKATDRSGFANAGQQRRAPGSSTTEARHTEGTASRCFAALRLLGHSLGLAAVVLVPGRSVQGVLGRVHDQVPLVVLLCALDGMERHRDVLFASAEEASDADDERAHTAFLINQDIHNLADFVVVRIVDILFVVVRHGAGIGRQRVEGLGGRGRRTLLSSGGRRYQQGEGGCGEYFHWHAPVSGFFVSPQKRATEKTVP